MYQIQISKRRQKFTTRYEFADERTAQFWFNAIRCCKNSRKRLVKAS